MKRHFAAKAAPATTCVILECYFDPHLDAYLVLGKINDSTEYFTGWKSRHKDSIVDTRGFSNEAVARKRFNTMIEEDELSGHPSLLKDYQKQRVYDWEEKMLMPHSKKINEKNARALINKIALDYGMSAPRLKWRKFTNYSKYDSEAIYFGARDNISLLHEMAHHIHDHAICFDDSLPHHSSGFVHCAIELYARYADIDPKFLLSSAHNKEILGDPAQSQAIMPVQPTGKRAKGNGRRKAPEPKRP